MTWTVAEWERAMEIATAGGPALEDLLTEIPTDGGFTSRDAPVPKGGKALMEIPSVGPDGSEHPVEGPTGVRAIIPPDGGFTTGEAATPQKKNVMNETPDRHPAKSDHTPLDWRAAAMAYVSSLKADVLSPPPGIPGMVTGPSGSPTVFSGPDSPISLRGLNTTRFHTDDGTHGAELSMPDGSFTIQNLGDLRAKIDQVVEMEKQSLDPRGRYQPIKNHIAKRAAAIIGPDGNNSTHLIPANWQLSMAKEQFPEAASDAKKKKGNPFGGKQAKPFGKKGDDDDDKKDDDDKDDDKEKDILIGSIDCAICWVEAKADPKVLVARKFSTAERTRLAKSGAAMENGKYPIENKSDLHNAIVRLHQGKGDKSTIRAHILKRAKALGASPDLMEHIGHLDIG